MLLSGVAGGAGPAGDWARSPRGYLLAWGIPTIALIGAAYLAPGPRAAVWIAALVWMAAGCLANARRCGRVHCRYTGPYYLALTVPVALMGLGAIDPGPWGWWIAAAAILLGGKLIWLVAEGLWGRYRA